MTFLTISIDTFMRWYVMFADHATIVSPVSLHHKLKEFVLKISDKI